MISVICMIRVTRARMMIRAIKAICTIVVTRMIKAIRVTSDSKSSGDLRRCGCALLESPRGSLLLDVIRIRKLISAYRERERERERGRERGGERELDRVNWKYMVIRVIRL